MAHQTSAMEKLCFLFVPFSSAGHINASVGLARGLEKKGHRVVFATELSWEGKLKALGFEEAIYKERDVKEGEEAGKYWSDSMNTIAPFISRPPKEQTVITISCYREFVDSIMFSDDYIKKVIEDIKPDVIIQDHYLGYPSLVNSGIPLVFLFSANPLALFENNELPPPYFGLPLNDRSDWEECRKKHHEAINIFWGDLNQWVVSKGAPPLRPLKFQYLSRNLNVFVYPQPCVEDYLRRIKLDPIWMNIDHAVIPSSTKFEIPAKLQALPGKLILFSLGSMGTSLIDVMKRFIAILGKVKHRFIVSTGQNHDKFELADNMWGQPSVPQTAILPLVDLFITHGGNNSFIESLYFGKPMIVFPLFYDQHDNAQRAVEMNIGFKFHTATVQETELLNAIETLLNDESVAQRLKHVSSAIQSSKSMDIAIDRIEEIARNPKLPNIITEV